MSGYVVMSFIGGHVYFCRLQGIAPEFAGLAWIQSVPRIGNLFTVYLFVFASAGCAHLVLGLPKALRTMGMRDNIGRLVVKRQTVGALLGLLAAGVLGIRGGFFATGAKFSNCAYARAHPEFR